MTLVKAAALCALMMTSTAFADMSANLIDIRRDKCIEKSNATTANVDACTGKAILEWDAALNKSYQSLIQKSNEKQKKALRNAQRAWLKFHDNEMDFLRSTAKGGSIDLLTQGRNRLEMIKKRALALQSHIQCIKEVEASEVLKEYSDDRIHYGFRDRTKTMCNWGKSCGDQRSEENFAYTLLDNRFGVAIAQIFTDNTIIFSLQIKDTSKCKRLDKRIEQIYVLIGGTTYPAKLKCLRQEGEYGFYKYTFNGSKAYEIEEHFMRSKSSVEVIFEDSFKVSFSSKGFVKAYKSVMK